MADGAISLQTRVESKYKSSTGPVRSKNTGYQFEKRLEKYELRRPVVNKKQPRLLPGTKEYLGKFAETAMPRKVC